MPAGLVRSGDFRNGTPIVLPHQFGNPVAGPNEPFGNPEPQSNPRMAGNPVDWLPSPAHFGNQVSFLLQTVPPIVIVAPGTTGTVDVNLTNLLGTNSAELTYFGEPAGVTISFSPNPDTTSSTVTVTVPSDVPAGKYTITIVGTATAPDLEYVQLHLVVAAAGSGGPAPTFTSITPNSGSTAGGTPFTIVGTNFITGATVSIGGVPATSIVVVDSMHITGVSPAGTAGATDVDIVTSNGTTDTPNAWTYTAASPLIAHTTAAGAVGPTGATTPAINTSGANFLTCAVFSYQGAQNASNASWASLFTFTDSFGNTWNRVTPDGPTQATPAPWLFYSVNPTVGPNHTLQLVITGDGGVQFTMQFAAWSGVATSSPEESHADTNNPLVATPLQPGSVTPANAGDLIISMLQTYDGFSGNPGLPASINDGFTVVDQVDTTSTAGDNGIASATTSYLIAPNTSALDPTWTFPAGLTAWGMNVVFAKS